MLRGRERSGAHSRHKRSGEPRQTTIENQTEYEPYLESVLGAAFDEARLHGRTLSLEEAVAYALGEPT